MADEVLLDRTGAVARLTINRPERRNAMSGEVISGLRDGLAECRADSGTRVVVLAGAGEKAFCAGADLAIMSRAPAEEKGEGGEAGGASTELRRAAGFVEQHEGRGQLARLFWDLWDLGKPTIARVQGYALAGGFGLALACDFVVASDTATFGTPEVNVGLWPYMITVPLVRSMPPKRALELMLTGRRVSAAEADRIGFVTRVVPPGELDLALDELASSLASKPPAVVKLGRDAFYSVWDQSAAEALRHLQAMLTVTTMTEDAAEGIAAFVEKRPPRWADPA